MRTGFRALAFAATVLAPALAVGQVTPACQQAVARGGAKFAKAVLKVSQRCALRASSAASCRPRAGQASGNAALDAAVVRATTRLVKRVARPCGRSDLSAFARRCPDASGPPLDLAELLACLRDTHVERVAGLVAVEFPAPALHAAQEGGCSAGQSCQCTCSSPSGAFLEEES